MKILILGAGQVGFGIANYLRSRNINVILIEKSAERALQLRKNSNLDIVIGDALNADTLKKTDIESANCVIATMSTDEQNLVACKFAGALFNVKTKIARLRLQTFIQKSAFELFLKDNFDIDIMVYPEQEIANYISNIVQVKGAFDVIKLENIVVVGIKCIDNTEVLNTTFKHFQGITDLNLFVLTVTRNGKTFFPKSTDTLIQQDEVYIATTRQHLNGILQLFGYPQEERQNILIIGGGNIGTFALQTIIAQNPNFNVTLIEKDQLKAESVSQKYPDNITILGDALNYELLRDISGGTDTAIVSTNEDKVNVLSSLFLNQLGVNRILTLTRKNNYDSLLVVNSGYSIINPAAITIETMVQKLRKSRVTSITLLKNQLAYIVEARVTETCSCIGNNIETIRITDQIIPIFILRKDSIIFAKKDVILALDDNVIILVEKNNLNKIEKIFSTFSFLKAKI